MVKDSTSGKINHPMRSQKEGSSQGKPEANKKERNTLRARKNLEKTGSGIFDEVGNKSRSRFCKLVFLDLLRKYFDFDFT